MLYSVKSVAGKRYVRTATYRWYIMAIPMRCAVIAATLGQAAHRVVLIVTTLQSYLKASVLRQLLMRLRSYFLMRE